MSPLLLAMFVGQSFAWTICPAAAEAGWKEVDGTLFGPDSFEQKFAADVYAQEQFSRLVERIRYRGTEIVVAVVPPRSVVALGPGTGETPANWATERAGYASTVAWFRRIGVRAPDLAQVGIGLRGRGKAMFRPEDGHWSPDGAIAAAGAIAAEVRAIRSFGWLGSSPQELVAGAVEKPPPGALLDALANACGTPAAPQWERPSYTVQRPPAPSSALLDDVPPPAVVAVSSSFGHPSFFFPQALGADLDAEILNIAVASGKVTSALRAWMESPEFAHPPDVLVWMFTTSHLFGPVGSHGATLRNPEGFRQLIPLADGGCTDQSAAYRLSVGVDGVIAGFGTALSSEGHYLQLSGEGLPPTGFSVAIRYGDGTDETLKIEPDERVRQSTQTLLEFRQFPPASVVSVALGVPPGKTLGSARALVCRYRSMP